MNSTTPEELHLFVYGTLRGSAGTAWSKFLSANSRFVGAGRTPGVLFHLDGYPGMAAGTDGHAWVKGEVYLLKDSSATLPLLDAYEGCGPGDPAPHEFERQVVPVSLDDGRIVQAWAYIYALETTGKSRITSGDYLRARSSG